jgi:sortase A
MFRFVIVLLALCGLSLFGHGAYIATKAQLAQLLLRRAFTETVATGHVTKPWSWADTYPVARIAVPRLDASAIALAGSSGQALAFGPGHVELTPDAGERGVAVYAAHRDTHFRFLRDVRIGDEIDVTRSDGQIFRYRADATEVVRFDASGIDPLAGGYELVLSTCWPFDALVPGPERYILHATMIGADSSLPHRAGVREGTRKIAAFAAIFASGSDATERTAAAAICHPGSDMRCLSASLAARNATVTDIPES